MNERIDGGLMNDEEINCHESLETWFGHLSLKILIDTQFVSQK